MYMMILDWVQNTSVGFGFQPNGLLRRESEASAEVEVGINLGCGELAHERAQMEEFDQKLDFIAAGIRSDKDAFLKFKESKLSKVGTERLARVFLFLRDMKGDNAPAPVPLAGREMLRPPA